MNDIEITSIAAWGEPKKVSTNQGPRILRTAPASEKFSALWKADKEACRAAGLGWGKDRMTAAWQIQWWAKDTSEASRVNEAVATSRATDAAFEPPAPAGLAYLPYQKAGVKFALDNPAALIADEMGLGKTIQAIGVINTDTSIHNVLIICPASLKINWKRELAAWLTAKLTVGIADGKTYPDDRYRDHQLRYLRKAPGQDSR